MLKNILFFASNLCCGRTTKDDYINQTYLKEDGDITDEEEKFIIWALKYYVDKNYGDLQINQKEIVKKNSTEDYTLIIEDKDKTDTPKDEDENSLDTSTNVSTRNSNDEKIKKIKTLPLLNLDNLNNLNYDSEKEYYENTEDKIRKIKKRFEMMNSLK